MRITHSDFDDWGIIYEQTTFKDKLPSEEELVALLKVTNYMFSFSVDYLYFPPRKSKSSHWLHGLHRF